MISMLKEPCLRIHLRFYDPEANLEHAAVKIISTYEVKVELKRVDMDQAMICGYLRIEGLNRRSPDAHNLFRRRNNKSKIFVLHEKKRMGRK